MHSYLISRLVSVYFLLNYIYKQFIYKHLPDYIHLVMHA
jgi:hypothetical protein